MTPVLIFKDENAIDNAQSQLHEAQQFYQNIVDQFSSLELGEGKNIAGNDLFLLIQNTKGFIVDKVTQGEKLAIGSMPISKEKAFEILELPPLLYQIISDIEKIKGGDHSGGFQIRNQVTNFIVNNGIVEFTDKYITDIEKTHSIFISTPDQLKAWELMQEIATKTNELRAITSTKGIGLRLTDFDLFFGLNDNSNSTTINKANPEAIKRLN